MKQPIEQETQEKIIVNYDSDNRLIPRMCKEIKITQQQKPNNEQSIFNNLPGKLDMHTQKNELRPRSITLHEN